MDNVHAQPTMESVKEVFSERHETLQKMNDVVVPKVQVEAQPSIHSVVKGKSFLGTMLDTPDDQRTKAVNSFILAKMKQQGIEDSEDGFHHILESLKQQAGLYGPLEPKELIGSVHKFLLSHLDNEDYLLFLNVLAQRERHNARI